MSLVCGPLFHAKRAGSDGEGNPHSQGADTMNLKLRYHPMCWKASIAGICLVLLAGCTSDSTAGHDDGHDKQWTFWPALPEAPRVQYLTSLSGSQDMVQDKHAFRDFVFGAQREQTFDLDKPYGVAAWGNAIYVTDVRGGCVAVFDLGKRELRLIGTMGQEKLIKPAAITIAPDGMKYVADVGRGSVCVFDAQDRFVTVFGHEGMNPVGVTTFGDELYVCDMHAGHIEVMDRSTGKSLRYLTFPKGSEGRPSAPLGIATDASGNLLISDVLNCRLLKMSPQGKVLKSLGALGDGPGCFTRPKHVAVDSDGITYVVDAAFQNVQMFNRDGRLLLSFGDSWGLPGGMDLPAGVCVVDGDMSAFAKYAHPSFQIQRVILVTNQFGPDKVAVYALGQQRPGMKVAGMLSRPTTQPGSGIAAGVPERLPRPAETRDVSAIPAK